MGWFDWVGSKPKKRPEDQRADEIMPAIDDLYQDHREQHHAGQDEAAQHYGDPPRSRLQEMFDDAMRLPTATQMQRNKQSTQQAIDELHQKLHGGGKQRPGMTWRDLPPDPSPPTPAPDWPRPKPGISSPQPQSHDQHAHEERDREADEHAMHHPHQRHHADGFNAEGWRGIPDGIRGNGAPAAHERGKQDGHAQDGDLDDRTHQTGQVSLKDQIFGAIGDRIPAPGVAPDGGHKRRR